MTSDEGHVFDDAPMCLCCEKAPAFRLLRRGSSFRRRFLIDDDLNVPVCNECALMLYRASVALSKTPGIFGCRPLGPDSGKVVLP